jgi:glucose-1-phosphate cytidylyltransferase
MISKFKQQQLVASFAAVSPSTSFHAVQSDASGLVQSIGPLQGQGHAINGGFFVLRQQIFDYLNEGEELVDQPFARLIENRMLGSYRHTGFWQAMDTFKDKITFDRMESRGECPWMVWKPGVGNAP